MSEPRIVILAGGISSRMKKTVESSSHEDPALLKSAREKPKAMISVGPDSRPFLDYSLQNIASAGYREVVIVTSERDNSIRAHYEVGRGADRFPGLSIGYVAQTIPTGRRKPRGTADALLTAMRTKPEWAGGKFTVCNSDNIYSVRALRLLLSDDHPNAMINYNRDALRFPPERVSQFAVIRTDEEGFLAGLVEKPSAGEIDSTATNGGVVGVSMNIFRLSYDMVWPFLESVPMHPARDEKELPVAVRMMAAERARSVFAIPLAEHVPDLTQISDVADVRSFLNEATPPA